MTQSGIPNKKDQPPRIADTGAVSGNKAIANIAKPPILIAIQSQYTQPKGRISHIDINSQLITVDIKLPIIKHIDYF